MPRRTMMIGGLVVVAIVAGVAAVVFLMNDDDDSPTLDTGATADGDLPPELEDLDLDDLDMEDLEDLDPGDIGPPPEALAFVEEYGVAGSTLHLAIEEERHESMAEPGARLQVLGDVWVDLDDEGSPTRFAARYYDGEGEMVQAVYQDLEHEIVAFIDETRMAPEGESPGCLQEGDGDQQLLAYSVPFLIEPEALEQDGFGAADIEGDALPGGAPETVVDDRVGEPDRVLDLSAWSEALIYEQSDAPEGMQEPGAPEMDMQQIVLLDPDSYLLLGQLTMLGEPEGDEQELGYRQGVGDIHVHDDSDAVDAAFDMDDAAAICEELES